MIVEFEWWLKAAVVVFIGAMSIAILMSRQKGLSGAGHGMVVGAPILSALVLWDLTSITLKRGLFNGGILWGAVVIAIGLSWSLVLYPVSVMYSTPGPSAVAIAGGIAVTLIIAFVPSRIMKRWIEWRENRIARLQSSSTTRSEAVRS